MTLLWGTPENPAFSKELVINDVSRASTAVMADGEYHEYTLELAGNPQWKGEVEELWFDPIPLRLAYTDVRWMRFE